MSKDRVPFPHPWPEKLLRDCAEITVGGTPSTSIPRFWGGEIPWMASGDIHSGRIRSVAGRITADGLRSSNAKLVPAKALAIALAGQGKTRGTVGLTEIALSTNQSVALVQPVNQELDAEFLYQSLIPRYEELRSRSAGGGRGGLTKTIIGNVPVQLPAPPEQRQIAELLSGLDEQIEATELVIEKSTVVRAALVRDSLGRLSGAPREPLAKLAQIGSGVTLGRKFVGPGTADYPYLRVANVQDGHVDLTEVKTLRLPQSVAARAMLQPGDVLMNEGGDFDKLGRGAVWRGQIPNCLHQNHVFRVRCNQDLLLPDFLALWAASEFGKKFFMLASKQSTNLASINSTQLKKFPVLRPSPDEQSDVLKTVEAIDSVLELDRAELAGLRLLKQGLARDLLTGKVRVPS